MKRRAKIGENVLCSKVSYQFQPFNKMANVGLMISIYDDTI